MSSMLRHGVASLAFSAAALFGGTVWAQGGDQETKERLKREIMAEVEKMLRAEEDRILKSVDQMLKEEFGKLGKKQEPPKPEPGPAPKARGYLGIRPAELTDDERQELGLKDDEGGVRIAEVLPDTPAGKAGLEVDDVIVRVDGRSFDGVQGAITLIGSKGPGQKVVFSIIRDNERKDIEVTLMKHPDDPQQQQQQPQQPPPKEEQSSKPDELRDRVRKFLEKEAPPKQEQPPKEQDPTSGLEDILRRLREGQGADDMMKQMREMIEKLGAQAPDGQQMLEQFSEQLKKMLENFAPGGGEPAPNRKPYLGILVEALSEEEAKKAGIPTGDGIFVSDVREGSAAAKSGFRKGDILVKINGAKVDGESSLKTYMVGASAGDEAEFVILREGKEQVLKVTLDAR